MAVILQGIGGPLSGRVGTLVGYTWKGRPCLRSLPQHFSYPNTEGQQRQRDWFVSMVRFASRSKDALRLGLRQAAAEAGMTEGNYFVLRNKQHFRRVAGGVQADYSRLSIAEGAAADVSFHAPRFEGGEVVSVEFDKNTVFSRSSSADSVYLYFYAPTLASGFLSAPAERRSKRLSVRLPQAWAGAEVHIYGFVVDKGGRASTSTYVGAGRVSHPEERPRYVGADAGWQAFVSIVEGAGSGRAPVASGSPTPSDAAPLPSRDADSGSSPGFI